MTPDDLPDVISGGISPDEVGRYLQAEIARMRRDPLNNSYPLHSQQRQFVARTGRRAIVLAANQIGKTEGEMRDVLHCARGEHPYRKLPPQSTLWIGCPDYPTYVRVQRPAFDKWCPAEWIIGEFHETDKYVDIKRADGGVCKIFFLSYDMPRSKWQGAAVDGIWLDEEPPEDIFNECQARLVTTRGWFILTFTPVEGIGWWYDRIWIPALLGQNGWQPFTAGMAEYDPDNAAECNVGRVLVPHLTREWVIDFAKQYPDPDERAIRVFGHVRSRSGLVYKMYAPDIHHVAAFTVPRHWPLWGGLDPGFHGFAAELFTQDEMGAVFRVGEFYSSHEATAVRLAGLEAVVRAVRDDEPEVEEKWHPYRQDDEKPEVLEPVVFFVDTEDPQVVLELNLEAARIGAIAAFASLDQGLKARKAGILRMQQLLQPDMARARPELVTRPTPATGEPTFYLCDVPESEWRDKDRLVHGDRLAWEMERYAWKPVTRQGVDPDDANDPSAGGAHALSACRYGAMARLGPAEEPKKEKKDDGSPLSEIERMVWGDLERAEAEALERAEERIEWDG